MHQNHVYVLTEPCPVEALLNECHLANHLKSDLGNRPGTGIACAKKGLTFSSHFFSSKTNRRINLHRI